MHKVLVELSDDDMEFLREWPVGKNDDPPMTIAQKVAFLVMGYRDQYAPEPPWQERDPNEPEIPF